VNDEDKTIPRPRAVGDMKQGLTGNRPKMSILPRVALVHGVRAIEYGADKYARGNYHGPPPPTVSPEDRLLGYIDATMRHLTKVADAINRAKGTGGDARAACSVVDADGGGKFPASSLPDLSHAIASMLIGVSCAADDGLLPEDPGQPWKAELGAEHAIPQKSDPASERARVAALNTEAIHAGQCISTAPVGHAATGGYHFGKNQMPAEMVPSLIQGGLAADLCPGPHDIILSEIPSLPSDGVPLDFERTPVQRMRRDTLGKLVEE